MLSNQTSHSSATVWTEEIGAVNTVRATRKPRNRGTSDLPKVLQKSQWENKNGTDISAFCLQPGGNTTSSKHCWLKPDCENRVKTSFLHPPCHYQLLSTCNLLDFPSRKHTQSLCILRRGLQADICIPKHNPTTFILPGSQISCQLVPCLGNIHCRAKKKKKRKEK